MGHCFDFLIFIHNLKRIFLSPNYDSLVVYFRTSVKARYNNGFKYCCILYVNNNTQNIVNYNAKCFASFILIQ